MTGASGSSFHDPEDTTGREWPRLARTRTLANSAVEFIENQPEQVFGESVAGMMGSEAPQYVPELDRFVASSSFTEENYFKESEQRMIQFKETLQRFHRTLEERKLDKKLGIKLKAPGDYKMQDVLQVAKELQAKHQSDAEARGCLGKIRRCFRHVVEHRGTLHSLLGFIPNDSYGSSICGGFTVILAAIDRAENLRDEVYTALAEIPRQLQQTSTLIDIHKQSRKLKCTADSVFIAIFEVLELIIKELTKSFTRKTVTLTLKGEHYGTYITTAVGDLSKAVKAFDEEARVCDSKRLGRIEDHTVGTRLTVEDTSIKIDAFYEQYERDRSAFAQSIEYQNRRLEELPSMVNKLYHFLASSPSFDAKRGVLDRYYARRMKILNEFIPNQLGNASSSSAERPRTALIEGRRALAREWIRETGIVNVDPSPDVESCLRDLHTLSLGEKDQVRWIIESDEVRNWLASTSSSTLVLDAETPPQNLASPLAAASAFLINAVASATAFPTLGYMSQYRTIEDPDPDSGASGPQALVESLVAQLVLYIAESRPTIDVEFLRKRKREKKHKASGQHKPKPRMSLSKLTALFGRLLDDLCEDDEDEDDEGSSNSNGRSNAVFVVIDSASRVQGPLDEAAAAVLQLIDAAEQADSVVKVLVTDGGAPFMLEAGERGIQTLYVPDRVDGGKQSLDVEQLEAEAGLPIEEFRRRCSSRRRRRRRSTDSLGTDDDSDTSDDYSED
ncbi:hypothetical protein F4775DRAFT_597235 [Biscogniauxia sp. FL1348]|nr:hypothetical protein F4775DRAFT_597235 [Biscogniauxia sp. FL1348]